MGETLAVWVCHLLGQYPLFKASNIASFENVKFINLLPFEVLGDVPNLYQRVYSRWRCCVFQIVLDGNGRENFSVIDKNVYVLKYLKC